MQIKTKKQSTKKLCYYEGIPTKKKNIPKDAILVGTHEFFGKIIPGKRIKFTLEKFYFKNNLILTT